MLNGPTNPLWPCDHYDVFLSTGKEGTVKNIAKWYDKTTGILYYHKYTMVKKCRYTL
jgi:hypothetical protein